MAQAPSARTTLLVLILAPVIIFGGLFSIILLAPPPAVACGPTGAQVGDQAAHVDPASVPKGPIAGYNHDQLVIAATIMVAAKDLGLSRYDQQLGVMTGMGESSLRNLDYGHLDSVGVFQQRGNGAWGSLADRMDPYIASTNFFKVLRTIENRADLTPTEAAHRVQRNADPNFYTPYWEPAVEVVNALASHAAGTRQQGPDVVDAGRQADAPDRLDVDADAVAPVIGRASQARDYNLGQVTPQLKKLVEILAPMFGIETVGGYRPSATDPGGHPAGLAADFMVPMTPDGRATGDALAAYAQANAGELAIDYIIWYQKIWSVERASEGWRPMEDRGSPTQNHLDHVHINVKPGGTVTDPGGGVQTAADCLPGAADPANGQQWMEPVKGPITSGYGPRINPVTGQASFHDGVDYGASCGTPIKAAGNGTVAAVEASSVYGTRVLIDHGGGIVTAYGHMYASGVKVKTGDAVTVGQEIAEVGSAGWSTGCHLHWSVFLKGEHTDPIKWIKSVMTSTGPDTQPVAAAPGSPQAKIVVATLNALGDSHTSGAGQTHPGMPETGPRTERLVRFLAQKPVGVVNLQEFQGVQQKMFHRLAGDTWAGYGQKDNFVIWRRDSYDALRVNTFRIPYFNGKPRHMPVVWLKHKATGRVFATISIHNPANVHGQAQHHRNKAVKIERSVVSYIGQTGTPVMLTGDFNDKRDAFCDVTAGGLMNAANGGSIGGKCRPPKNMIIDWLFGRQVRWSNYHVDGSTRPSITDHRYVQAIAELV